MSLRPAPPWRLTDLERRLTAEAPERLPLLRACRDMDRLLQRTGFLPRGDSLATRTAWWPLVTVLGADTPARGAFLARFRLADGERPALLCHGAPVSGADPRRPAGIALPTIASDADTLRGRVLADAGGDAPQELAEALVERSDLVLVFADAEHPEPDALKDLVARALRRADARKLLTIHGEADLASLDARLEEASAERARRIAGLLDSVAEELEDELIPFVEASLARWRHAVRRGALVWLAILAGVLGGAVLLGGSENLPAFGAWLLEARPALFGGLPVRLFALAGGVFGLWLAGHWWVRRVAARRYAADLPARLGEADLDPRRAFSRSTGLFRAGIAGWGRRARRRLAAIREAAMGAVGAAPGAG